MTIKQFIEKSMKGGYEPNYDFSIEYPSQILHTDNGSILLTGEGGKILGVYDIEKILLDPNLWRCAGKEMGWSIYAVCSHCGDTNCIKKIHWKGEPEPLYHCHRLIDHIFAHKSIESFFESL